MLHMGRCHFHSSCLSLRGKSRALKATAGWATTVKSTSTALHKITDKDIARINKLFLLRTNGLEDISEIKKLPQIRNEMNQRYAERYFKPSREWDTSLAKIKSTANGKKLLSQSDKSYSFYPEQLARSPLTIGDLVVLNTEKTALSMCVGLPQSVKDPRYTFVNISGDIIFATRNAILLRIPYELPSPYADFEFLQHEKMHGYAPIGTIKGTIKETYILPIIARQKVTSLLPAKITKDAAKQLPLVQKKLEFLQRCLQDSKGTYQYPFFDLVRLVEKVETKDLVGTDYPQAAVNFRQYTNHSDNSPINAATMLAVFWGISSGQTTHLWGKMHMNRALLSPISVSVLPFQSQHLYYNMVLETSNNDRQLKKLAQLINARDYVKAAEEFPDIIQLLTDFAAGNINMNSIAITVVSKLLRKIDGYEKDDITRDRVQDLLNDFFPDRAQSNPLLRNLDLALPSSSRLSTQQKELYAISEPIAFQKEIDRTDFRSLPVYCIDSASAHEIDDGVSIEDKGNGKFILYVHIADPISLFKFGGNSTSLFRNDVFDVAYQKSFTTYLPDLVSPMLPETFAKKADLGKLGSTTNTITFSIELTLSDTKSSVELNMETFRVCLGTVSNFPQDTTYEDVDNIIEGKKNVEPKIKSDLTSLYQVAKLLRKKRVDENGAVIFGEGFNAGLVQLDHDDSDNSVSISFSNPTETKSSILVSEIMILANTLAGSYFRHNGISGIFRSYNCLHLGPTAQQEYRAMQKAVKDGNLPSVRDITMLSSLLNTSFYTVTPSKHEMIGAPQYLTVTSPLRRFPDLVNHLQLHCHLKGSPAHFTEKQIKAMLWQIQSRDIIIRNMARQVNTYWTLKYLQNLIRQDPNAKFDVLITSVPALGSVGCIFPQYSFARGTLKLNLNAKIFPAIGDIVKDRSITKIDCLDALIELA